MHYYRVSSSSQWPNGEFYSCDETVAICEHYNTALGIFESFCSEESWLFAMDDDEAEEEGKDTWLAHAVWRDEDDVEHDFRIHKKEMDK